VNKCIKILSGYQPYQCWAKTDISERDCLLKLALNMMWLTFLENFTVKQIYVFLVLQYIHIVQQTWHLTPHSLEYMHNSYDCKTRE
jgi:hypothetical protein